MYLFASFPTVLFKILRCLLYSFQVSCFMYMTNISTKLANQIMQGTVRLLGFISCCFCKPLLSTNFSRFLLSFGSHIMVLCECIAVLDSVSDNMYIYAVSRFLLFVVTPTWVANGLRYSIVGGIFCLIIGVLVVITAIQGIGGFSDCFSNCQCNCHCFVYCLSIGFIFFFTILYLCSETW